MNMRKLKTEELKLIKPSQLTEEEILALDPVWCVICEKFIPYAEKIDGYVFYHSFNASIKVGGHYCSWHKIENHG